MYCSNLRNLKNLVSLSRATLNSASSTSRQTYVNSWTCKRYLSLSGFRFQDSETVEIGGVVKQVKSSKNWELIPSKYCELSEVYTLVLIYNFIFVNSDCWTKPRHSQTAEMDDSKGRIRPRYLSNWATWTLKASPGHLIRRIDSSGSRIYCPIQRYYREWS